MARCPVEKVSSVESVGTEKETSAEVSKTDGA
jgi:hypothetical protein